MKLHTRRIVSLLVALCLLLMPWALADSITFTGTVTASETHEVYAPIGGTVEKVLGEAGQKVKADDVIVKLSTTKVYAEESGTVTGVFGQPGDSAETVAQKYGAVVAIEGEFEHRHRYGIVEHCHIGLYSVYIKVDTYLPTVEYNLHYIRVLSKGGVGKCVG